MITPSQIREKKISTAQDGYDRNEVNELLVEIIDSYDTVCAENKELYRKMEILAGKIEEYREDEDSIKTAIISAQKVAHQIKAEAKEQAEKTVSESNASAQQTLKEVQEQADKIIGEAREYVASLTKEKTDAAQAIVSEAEHKANVLISSAKLVAQDTVDKAKELTKKLIDTAKKERESEELFAVNIKSESDEFKASLIALYEAQLAKLTSCISSKNESTADIEAELDSLASSVDDITVEELEEIDVPQNEDELPESSAQQEITEQDSDEVEEEIEEEISEPENIIVLDDIESSEDDVNEDDVTPFSLEENTDEVDEIIKEIEQDEPSFEVIEEDDEPLTPEEIEEALNAFSDDEITPVEGTGATIPVIEEEPEFEPMPFESFFDVGKTDVNTDETISLTAPEEEDEDDDKSKFKGFFKKRK